jgi:hypothetical protein
MESSVLFDFAQNNPNGSLGLWRADAQTNQVILDPASDLQPTKTVFKLEGRMKCGYSSGQGKGLQFPERTLVWGLSEPGS